MCEDVVDVETHTLDIGVINWGSGDDRVHNILLECLIFSNIYIVLNIKNRRTMHI
jgi:hypothetical protein